MIVKTKGIVFKTLKYGETSLIADIYTEQIGLQKYMISGVRKSKAKISPGLLQVGSLIELVAYNRPDRPLNRIKEIRVAHLYESIPFNVRKAAISLFFIEVVRKTIREAEENPRLFSFLFNSFRFLDLTNENIGNLPLSFLIEFSAFLGFIPSSEKPPGPSYFDLKEGVFVLSIPKHPHYLDEFFSNFLYQLLTCGFETCHILEIPHSNKQALLRYLLDYYKLHIEHFSEIHSHEVLREIMGEGNG